MLGNQLLCILYCWDAPTWKLLAVACTTIISSCVSQFCSSAICALIAWSKMLLVYYRKHRTNKGERERKLRAADTVCHIEHCGPFLLVKELLHYCALVLKQCGHLCVSALAGFVFVSELNSNQNRFPKQILAQHIFTAMCSRLHGCPCWLWLSDNMNNFTILCAVIIGLASFDLA